MNYPFAKPVFGKSRSGSRQQVQVVTTGKFSIDRPARPDVERVVIGLPFPPATNNLFFNVAGHGRVTTDRYRAWQEEAAWRIHAQKPGRIMGPFSVEIVISRPDKRRRDLDGLAKPILDCLVKNSIVEDDSLCERLVMEWAPANEGVLVTLMRAGARA